MGRGLILLFTLFTAARAGSLEDAVRSVARGLAARLAIGESVQITAKNLSSLPAQELEKARSLTQRALRRTPARNKPPLEVFLSLSENPQGFLLIGELRRPPGERYVEMAAFDATPQTATIRAILTRRLLWQQSTPLLDVQILDNRMLVLDTQQLTVYESRDGKWEPAVSKLIPSAPSRDPQGVIEVSNTQLTLTINDTRCEGTLQPTLDITCTASPQPQQPAEISAKISELCGAKNVMFQTTAVDWQSPDTLSIADSSNRLEFPSPITALQARAGAVLAITANHAEEIHSAYLVSVDCSR
ncbi:MAG: hypothetical protein JST93_27185 [Acidobacteria bacterium]|nr:hypothetical protein [Acidobacteriota bacterium]